MPIPAHQRVQIVGILQQASGSGSDIFSFGWAVLPGQTDVDLAVAMAPLVKAHWDDNGIGAYATAIPTGVIVETIAAGGKVTNSYREPITAGNPGLNTSAIATFDCAVITLETGQRDSKGTKVRGRFFPPACFSGIVGSSTDPTDRDAYRDAWVNFLAYMETAGSSIAVASSTNVGLAQSHGITVDNIVDSQRSRKNRVISQRSAVANFS